MPEEKRRVARDAILSLSALPPAEFLEIASVKHLVPESEWKFEEYHAAAAAAVQEDIKLNKIIYKLVPRKLTESEFWRLCAPRWTEPIPPHCATALPSTPTMSLAPMFFACPMCPHAHVSLRPRTDFSEVLFVLESVKKYGKYPPPPPPPSEKPAERRKPPPPPSESSCLLM